MKMFGLSVLIVIVGLGSSYYTKAEDLHFVKVGPSLRPLQKKMVFNVDKGDPINDDWEILRGRWNSVGNIIQANRDVSESNAANVLMVRKEKIKGKYFSITSKVKILSPLGSSMAGIAFNVQDVNNYYAFRFNVNNGDGFFQIVRVVDGKAQQISVKRHQGSIKEKEFYIVTLSSDNNYLFSWAVSDLNGNVVDSGEAKDASKLFKGGRLGLYAVGSGEYADFKNETK